jgi:CspA family cold shock protein
MYRARCRHLFFTTNHNHKEFLEMLKGEVKFWNDERGFGFLKRDDGQADVFVHASQLLGTCNLTAGQSVEFDLGRIPSNDRPCAVSVRVRRGE